MDAQYSTSGLTCENQKTPVAATDAGSYSAPANAKLSQLQKKLAELFEMDKSDLDFGIYRVFNLKRRQIANYLEKELPRAVSALEDKALEDEVYSHLYRFFERYYVDGDFISRHFQGKDNNYVIPSNGEEVALYWANQDQYYIKSADILQDYKFKFEVPAIDSTGRDIIKTRTVKFFIVASDQVKDNNKVINDQVFAFLPARDMDDVHFLEIIDEELQIPVKNVLVNKAEKPDFMAVLTSEIDFRPGIQEWLRPALEPLTDKDGKLIPGSSLLKKHWDTYSSRRKSDFFIHKNLKKFLCGELDYYLKSMVVQNLNNATPAELEKLSKVITAIRHIAIGDNRVPGLITFLAEFENFQRKIWLKKKLVLDAGYCITLDKIPEQYYKAIVGNTAQVQEWEELGLLNESAEPQNVLAMDNLNKWAALQKTWKDHQLPGMPSLSLMANTKYMTAHNRCSILEAIGDAVDEKCDGIVINSENFQALNLMGKKFKEQIKCMYIDPPYNTGNDGFLYKDGYKSSSWLSSLYDRVYTSLPMLSDDGIFLSSIADHEVDKMRLILHELFGRENFLANFVWNNEGNIDNQSKVKVNHEYILSYCKNEKN
jgi:adenine-specific DNA-methyltransferase